MPKYQGMCQHGSWGALHGCRPCARAALEPCMHGTSRAWCGYESCRSPSGTAATSARVAGGARCIHGQPPNRCRFGTTAGCGGAGAGARKAASRSARPAAARATAGGVDHLITIYDTGPHRGILR